MKGANQWVGEDVVILQSGEPFYFSVVAVGRVTAYEISKHDLMTKMPP
jgi:hypothetical protein